MNIVLSLATELCLLLGILFVVLHIQYVGKRDS